MGQTTLQKTWFKTITLTVVVIFTLTSIPCIEEAHALSPWAGLQSVEVRTDIASKFIEKSKVQFAEQNSPQLNGEDIVFLEEGRLLVSEALKDNPRELLREIFLTQIRALMLLLKRTHPERYSMIEEIIPMENASGLYTDLMVSRGEEIQQQTVTLDQVVAEAVTLMLLLEKTKILVSKELSREETLFLGEVMPVIEGHSDTHFPGVFWDEDDRDLVLRTAIAGDSGFAGLLNGKEVAESRKTLGEVVLEARRAKGWNQAELAERAGVVQATISHVEDNKTRRPSTVKKIGEALGMDFAQYLMDSSKRSKQLSSGFDKHLLAKNLKRLRRKKGLRQADLAVKAGVSTPTLVYLENAQTEFPHKDTIRRLARALGVSRDGLLGSGVMVEPQKASEVAKQIEEQTPSFEDLGKEIKRLRHEQDLTQVELAEKAGISQAALSYAERGLFLGLKTVSRLSIALGLKAADLYCERKAARAEKSLPEHGVGEVSEDKDKAKGERQKANVAGSMEQGAGSNELYQDKAQHPAPSAQLNEEPRASSLEPDGGALPQMGKKAKVEGVGSRELGVGRKESARENDSELRTTNSELKEVSEGQGVRGSEPEGETTNDGPQIPGLKLAKVQEGMTPIDGVFEGGGAKGVAYGGALDVLAEKGLWFRRVAGTSAGAITASLIAMGYDHKAMRTIMMETNFNDFKDLKWGFLPTWLNMLIFGGLYWGDYFEKWIDKKFEEKLGFSPTMKDIPIPLTLVASNISDKEMLILSAETAPNLKVSTAVRMSMGIPFFFNVFRWFGSYKNKIKIRRVVDGGLLSNFPLFVLENDGEHGVPVLGFRLHEIKKKKKHKTFWNIALGLLKKLPVIDIAVNALSTGMDAHDNRHIEDDDWARIVNIPVDVGTTDFDLTKAKKEELMERGRVATEKVLDKKLTAAERLRAAKIGELRAQKESTDHGLSAEALAKAGPRSTEEKEEARSKKEETSELDTRYEILDTDESVEDDAIPQMGKKARIAGSMEQGAGSNELYQDKAQHPAPSAQLNEEPGASGLEPGESLTPEGLPYKKWYITSRFMIDETGKKRDYDPGSRALANIFTAYNLTAFHDYKNAECNVVAYIPDGLPQFYTIRSSEKLKEINGLICHILENAVKYGGDEDVIVRLLPRGAGLHLEVEDSGIGIPSEEIKHLTESGYRGSNVGDVYGRGDGLSMAMAAVGRLGATLGISSEEGKGTTVSIDIPEALDAKMLPSPDMVKSYLAMREAKIIEAKGERQKANVAGSMEQGAGSNELYQDKAQHPAPSAQLNEEPRASGLEPENIEDTDILSFNLHPSSLDRHVEPGEGEALLPQMGKKSKVKDLKTQIANNLHGAFIPLGIAVAGADADAAREWSLQNTIVAIFWGIVLSVGAAVWIGVNYQYEISGLRARLLFKKASRGDSAAMRKFLELKRRSISDHAYEAIVEKTESVIITPDIVDELLPRAWSELSLETKILKKSGKDLVAQRTVELLRSNDMSSRISREEAGRLVDFIGHYFDAKMPPEIFDVLINVLNGPEIGVNKIRYHSGSVDLRTLIMQVLSGSDDERLQAAMIRILDEKSKDSGQPFGRNIKNELEVEVIKALGSFEDIKTLDALIHYISSREKDEDSDGVLCAAIVALYKFDSPDVKNTLLDLLKETDQYWFRMSREAAVEGLRKYYDETVENVLLNLIGEVNPRWKEARSAVDVLRTEDHIDAINVRKSLMRLLQRAERKTNSHIPEVDSIAMNILSGFDGDEARGVVEKYMRTYQNDNYEYMVDSAKVSIDRSYDKSSNGTIYFSISVNERGEISFGSKPAMIQIEHGHMEAAYHGARGSRGSGGCEFVVDSTENIEQTESYGDQDFRGTFSQSKNFVRLDLPVKSNEATLAGDFQKAIRFIKDIGLDKWPLVLTDDARRVARQGGVDSEAARDEQKTAVKTDTSEPATPVMTPEGLEKDIKVLNPSGVHAYTVALIFKASQKYPHNSALIIKGENLASIDDTAEVMALVISAGETVKVIVDGESPEKLLAEIEKYLVTPEDQLPQMGKEARIAGSREQGAGSKELDQDKSQHPAPSAPLNEEPLASGLEPENIEDTDILSFNLHPSSLDRHVEPGEGEALLPQMGKNGKVEGAEEEKEKGGELKEKMLSSLGSALNKFKESVEQQTEAQLKAMEAVVMNNFAELGDESYNKLSLDTMVRIWAQLARINPDSQEVCERKIRFLLDNIFQFSKIRDKETHDEDISLLMRYISALRPTEINLLAKIREEIEGLELKGVPENVSEELFLKAKPFLDVELFELKPQVVQNIDSVINKMTDAVKRDDDLPQMGKNAKVEDLDDKPYAKRLALMVIDVVRVAYENVFLGSASERPLGVNIKARQMRDQLEALPGKYHLEEDEEITNSVSELIKDLDRIIELTSGLIEKSDLDVDEAKGERQEAKIAGSRAQGAGREDNDAKRQAPSAKLTRDTNEALPQIGVEAKVKEVVSGFDKGVVKQGMASGTKSSADDAWVMPLDFNLESHLVDLLEKYVDGPVKGKKVLEIGFGPHAGNMERLVKEGAIVSAFDANEDYIIRAKVKLPGVTFRRGNFLKRVDFEDGEFDAVIFSNVLDFASTRKSRRKFFDEVARLLKPGGTLVYTDIGDDGESEILFKTEDKDYRIETLGYHRSIDAGTAAKDAGLEMVARDRDMGIGIFRKPVTNDEQRSTKEKEEARSKKEENSELDTRYEILDTDESVEDDAIPQMGKKARIAGSREQGAGSKELDQDKSQHPAPSTPLNEEPLASSLEPVLKSETEFEEYLRDNDLHWYRALRTAFDPAVTKALLEDPALRPVFMQVLPGKNLGPLHITGPAEVAGSEIEELLESHSVFLVGDAETADHLVREGNRIIVGVTDRASNQTLMPVNEVANGRQAYFPLPDGTWLGVKGSGQFNSENEPPHWFRNQAGYPPRHEGIAWRQEAQTAERAALIIDGREAGFSQLLGYRPVYSVPNGKGGFQDVNGLVDNYNKNSHPVLIFHRTISPHRIMKIPQLLESDPGLRKMARRISGVLTGQGYLSEGSVLKPDEMVAMMMGRFGRQEAIKQNFHLYKETIHSQDLTFAGEEADIEELVESRRFIISLNERFAADLADGKMHGSLAHVLTSILDDGLSVYGMLAKLSALNDMVKASRNSLRYMEDDRLFPDPAKALEILFRSYFSELEEEWIRVWIAPSAYGYSHPLMAILEGDDLRAINAVDQEGMNETIVKKIAGWAQEELDTRLSAVALAKAGYSILDTEKTTDHGPRSTEEEAKGERQKANVAGSMEQGAGSNELYQDKAQHPAPSAQLNEEPRASSLEPIIESENDSELRTPNSELTEGADKMVPPDNLVASSEDMFGIPANVFEGLRERLKASLMKSEKTAQSLILYADDIVNNATIIDLEDTLREFSKVQSPLSGGKVFLYAQDAKNGTLLKGLIKNCAPTMDIVIITSKDLMRDKNLDGSETDEVAALVECAAARGADDILALIKGARKDFKRDKPEDLVELSMDLKVPIILLGLDKAVYSLGEALAQANRIIGQEGVHGWVVSLLPIRKMSEEMHERYLQHLAELRIRTAA